MALPVFSLAGNIQESIKTKAKLKCQALVIRTTKMLWKQILSFEIFMAWVLLIINQSFYDKKTNSSPQIKKKKNALLQSIFLLSVSSVLSEASWNHSYSKNASQIFSKNLGSQIVIYFKYCMRVDILAYSPFWFLLSLAYKRLSAWLWRNLEQKSIKKK